jgi:HlyD family secretion protein
MMSIRARRIAFFSPALLALLLALAWTFKPVPVPVDLAVIERGDLEVSVNEEGVTRVRDIFVLSAPVAGLKRRTPHEVGDPVIANGTVIASIEPSDPAFLDIRSEALALAEMRAAEASLKLADAEVERASAELEYAESEVERARRLSRAATISESALADAERLYRTARAALDEANARLRVREFELQRARSLLLPRNDVRGPPEECDCVHVYSPIDGTILRVLNESESVVQAGTPLAEIGNPRDLEIVVDLLSSDAVRVEPGDRSVIRDWGGAEPLTGVVRQVEPYGITQISALGIEEQRVNAIIDITSPTADWLRLGHGYHVEVDIVVMDASDVVKVPFSALFRDAEAWAVFVVRDGTAHLVHVEIGPYNSREAAVESGLAVGDRVVLHASERIADGIAVIER